MEGRAISDKFDEMAYNVFMDMLTELIITERTFSITALPIFIHCKVT